MSIAASIIICTRDRAQSLRKTLEAIGNCEVPESLTAELVVVDNGSSDHTRQVVESAGLKNVPVRYVLEPQPGQVHARNRGLGESRGAAADGIVAFTDDDVRPATDWLRRLTDPILTGRADGVCGAVRMAPHLERPWLQSWQRTVLACTDRFDAGQPVEMVGANMAMSAKVLRRVSGFDPELGPGALGFGDDSLFSNQAREAGFRIVYEPAAVVVHHFDPSRLSRRQLLQTAEKQGRTWAYNDYHWVHKSVRHPLYHFVRAKLRLAWWTLRHCAQPRPDEGCALWEMDLRQGVHYYDQWLKEMRRPRQYDRHGLIKRSMAVG
jgi:glycosyltransferase involved in cell wall biosynthesis